MDAGTLDNWEPTTEPDPDEIAEVMKKAKGPRTGRQFALATGLTEATISRAINGIYMGRMSKEQMLGVFQHRYNRADTDLLRDLARANGWVAKGSATASSPVVPPSQEWLRKKRKTVEQMQNAIIICALQSGAQLQLLSPRIEWTEYSFLERAYSPDQVLSICNSKDDATTITWYIRLITATRDNTTRGFDSRLFLAITTLIMYDSTGLFLRPNAKFSVAFNDPDCFEYAKEIYGAMEVNNEISFILTYADQLQVVEEYTLPTRTNIQEHHFFDHRIYRIKDTDLEGEDIDANKKL